MKNEMNQTKKVVTAVTAHSNTMDRSCLFIFGMRHAAPALAKAGVGGLIALHHDL